VSASANTPYKFVMSFNEETKLKQDVVKDITFWSLPQILIIDLKRWNFSSID